jgi:hypothetical protein
MCLWRTNCCLILGVTVGAEAVVELGKLGDNPDIAVLIEGHTDDDLQLLVLLLTIGIYQLKGRPLL